MASLILTQTSVARLARRADLVAAFPFLKPPRASSARCGGCAADSPSADWRRTAAAIFSLSKTRRVEFKAAVGADSVVWRVRSGGKMVDRYL